jgi:DNA-binding protein HU-beta
MQTAGCGAPAGRRPPGGWEWPKWKAGIDFPLPLQYIIPCHPPRRSQKMNKNDIAQLMVKDSSIIKSNALKVIDTLVAVIGDQLKKKQGKVTLVGFGTFKAIEKKAKVGRNPKTGARINIPKKRVPKFLAGKELKALVK